MLCELGSGNHAVPQIRRTRVFLMELFHLAADFSFQLCGFFFFFCAHFFDALFLLALFLI
jgi:hypothetical protein